MILILDNYDSFVYNLDRYLQRLGQRTLVVRSDAITVEAIGRLDLDAIVISPGPKSPDEAGCSMEVVRRMSQHTPILGVCLGHQAIGQAFGGRIVRANAPMHGKASTIQHDGSPIFEGIPNRFQVGRYHSLVIEASTSPDALNVIATSDDGTIMAVKHVEYPVFGVQFHPESILTLSGYQVLANFLKLCGLRSGDIPNDDLRR
ncbi:MAG: aminodeoxychorismate/anthranilate synthase component II [Planctomycetota bacterium]|nr:aminodeoxychorismate/anthranilate synthase component II [Planctomycetota bacterium]